MFYTRKCGEIEDSDFGSEQTLCGWLQDTRNLGGIAFLQLRDITGVIQLTLLKKKLDPDDYKKWTNINRESIVLVRGIVKENKEAPGGVEMLPDNIEEGSVKRLGEMAENSNSDVTIISTESEEGVSLQKAFGGLAAILRYPIN